MTAGRTRRKKIPSALRGVIAKNIADRAAVVFHDAPNVPMAIREASGSTDATRMAKSNIQKIMRGETSPTIEQLEGLGRALDIPVYRLLQDGAEGSKAEAFYQEYLSLPTLEKRIVESLLRKHGLAQKLKKTGTM